jgi:hypothetical protein
VVAQTDGKDEVVAELQRIRELVRSRALMNPAPGPGLPDPLATRSPEAIPQVPETPPPSPGVPPDLEAVAEAAAPMAEPPGLLRRVLGRLLAPALARPQAFAARQLQFDHQVIAYLHTRLDETHRHYDAILGLHSRHMAEVDERHAILQEELVAHVHDLVRRIDLVLSEAERGRLSLEFALQDLRARLSRLEARLSRE